MADTPTEKLGWGGLCTWMEPCAWEHIYYKQHGWEVGELMLVQVSVKEQFQAAVIKKEDAFVGDAFCTCSQHPCLGQGNTHSLWTSSASHTKNSSQGKVSHRYQQMFVIHMNMESSLPCAHPASGPHPSAGLQVDITMHGSIFSSHPFCLEIIVIILQL